MDQRGRAVRALGMRIAAQCGARLVPPARCLRSHRAVQPREGRRSLRPFRCREIGVEDAMHFFSVKDVERVLRIPRSAIRTLIRGGYVAPKRGQRRQYEFSFQDLIALRTARALILARVSPRRISQALEQLRKEVPPELPTAKLRIGASGTELVVRDQSGPWRAPSGQLLLEFDANLSEGPVEILDRATLDVLQGSAGAKPLPRGADADEFFEQALALEETDATA